MILSLLRPIIVRLHEYIAQRHVYFKRNMIPPLPLFQLNRTRTLVVRNSCWECSVSLCCGGGFNSNYIADFMPYFYYLHPRPSVNVLFFVIPAILITIVEDLWRLILWDWKKIYNVILLLVYPFTQISSHAYIAYINSVRWKHMCTIWRSIPCAILCY